MMPIKKKALMPPGLLGPLAAVISTAVAFTADAQVQDCARGARGVIARFAGAEVAASVKIEEIPCTPDGRLVYEIADNGRTIRGCRIGGRVRGAGRGGI